VAIELAPAFQFYVKEWRSSRAVQRMTYAQRGMYLEMLLEQWENLSVPDSPTECAALLGGTDEEWIGAWPALRRNFVDLKKSGRPAKSVEPGTVGRIVNLRLESGRKERKAHLKRSRNGGITRALTASRGNDGTYHPAGEPAGVQPEGQPEIQVESSTPSSSPSASASASASAVKAQGRVPMRGTLVTPHRALAHNAYFSDCGDVPNWLHNEFTRKLANSGLDDGAAEKRAFAFYAEIEAKFKGQIIGEEPRVFWRARFAEAFSAPVVGSASPRTAGNRAGLDRFASRGGH
jgi:hypothetical protein